MNAKTGNTLIKPIMTKSTTLVTFTLKIRELLIAGLRSRSRSRSPESGVEGFLAGVGVGVGVAMSQGLESGVRVEFLWGWSRELVSESELLWARSRKSELESESEFLRGRSRSRNSK